MSFSGRCFTQIIGEEEGRPIYLFSTDSPLRSMTGDFEGMAFYAGNGVDKIDAIIPAGERACCRARPTAQGRPHRGRLAD